MPVYHHQKSQAPASLLGPQHPGPARVTAAPQRWAIIMAYNNYKQEYHNTVTYAGTYSMSCVHISSTCDLKYVNFECYFCQFKMTENVTHKIRRKCVKSLCFPRFTHTPEMDDLLWQTPFSILWSIEDMNCQWNKDGFYGVLVSLLYFFFITRSSIWKTA